MCVASAAQAQTKEKVDFIYTTRVICNDRGSLKLAMTRNLYNQIQNPVLKAEKGNRLNNKRT